MRKAVIPAQAGIHSCRGIRTEIPKTCDTILGDPTQIHQVLLNLCTNASHAMEENGGILKIGVNSMTSDEIPEIRDSFPNPNRYLRLTVSDTGHGIPPDIINRIFDPYFTTKGVGRGTGLGLSVVRNIVAHHGGTITVRSEAGKGTEFVILFPIVEEKEKIKTTNSSALPTGNEQILSVDDEPQVGIMIRKILEQLGYRVKILTDPTEALNIFRLMPDQFDLIITDMTMPKMTGDKLARELLKIRLDIPIILCTGYSVKINEQTAKEIGIRKYMEKPVRKSELAITVRNLLDENRV